ncbi:MAG: DUF4158 domain-containing protein [Candidatus Thiodiazotropha sp. (ex Lucinoma kastoroae)]|nr:DUF4158 domain-containing protein [Candidatus Thiodiazotropha sp. (ex Lucinoma kastoroae)]
MKANQNRLSILTQSEIQAYFGIPRLTQEDREYYFELAANKVKLISENWPLNSKLYFVLQLGYFKARRMFFSFNDDKQWYSDASGLCLGSWFHHGRADANRH